MTVLKGNHDGYTGICYTSSPVLGHRSSLEKRQFDIHYYNKCTNLWVADLDRSRNIIKINQRTKCIMTIGFTLEKHF